MTSSEKGKKDCLFRLLFIMGLATGNDLLETKSNCLVVAVYAREYKFK